jgi:hypothetical protein
VAQEVVRKVAPGSVFNGIAIAQLKADILALHGTL